MWLHYIIAPAQLDCWCITTVLFDCCMTQLCSHCCLVTTCRLIESLEREPPQRSVLTLQLLMCCQVGRGFGLILWNQAGMYIHVYVCVCTYGGGALHYRVAAKGTSSHIPTVSTTHQYMHNRCWHWSLCVLNLVISSEYNSALPHPVLTSVNVDS